LDRRYQDVAAEAFARADTAATILAERGWEPSELAALFARARELAAEPPRAQPSR